MRRRTRGVCALAGAGVGCFVGGTIFDVVHGAYVTAWVQSHYLMPIGLPLLRAEMEVYRRAIPFLVWGTALGLVAGLSVPALLNRKVR